MRDPRDDSPEVAKAVADNPEYAALRDELLAMERHLEVTPPPSLHARLMAIPDQYPEESCSWLDRFAFWRDWSWHAALPAAASLLFAVSLGLYFWPMDADSIRRDVLSHMYSELLMLENDKEVDISMVNEHMGEFGAHLEANASTQQLDVMDMKDIRIAHEQGLHLVVKTSDGPVSVIIMDSTPIEGEHPIHDGRFSGVITPVGKGNLAILSDGNQERGVAEVKSVLSKNIVW